MTLLLRLSRRPRRTQERPPGSCKNAAPVHRGWQGESGIILYSQDVAAQQGNPETVVYDLGTSGVHVLEQQGKLGQKDRRLRDGGRQTILSALVGKQGVPSASSLRLEFGMELWPRG